MEKHLFNALKKYGLTGIVLCYFLIQDNNSRQLDRKERENNINIIRTLAEKITDMNTRITIMEFRLDKLTEDKKNAQM